MIRVIKETTPMNVPSIKLKKTIILFFMSLEY